MCDSLRFFRQFYTFWALARGTPKRPTWLLYHAVVGRKLLLADFFLKICSLGKFKIFDILGPVIPTTLVTTKLNLRTSLVRGLLWSEN